jgi:hypothetical protein
LQKHLWPSDASSNVSDSRSPKHENHSYDSRAEAHTGAEELNDIYGPIQLETRALHDPPGNCRPYARCQFQLARFFMEGRRDGRSQRPDSSPWTLQSAAGINASGPIAGQGLINGEVHAFIAMPCHQHEGRGGHCENDDH